MMPSLTGVTTTHYVPPLSGLSPADLEVNGQARNGSSSDTEHEEMKEDKEVKEEEADPATKPRSVLTPFELEGLWNLLGKLEELPAHKKCVPAGIRNATALLQDMRVSVNKATFLRVR